MKIFKEKKQILGSVHPATGFIERFIGLLGKKSIPPGYAMYFPDCNSIHTYFMKMPIDVIMLDSGGKIVFVRENMAPWKTAVCLKAKTTLEMKAGEIRRMGLKVEDQLKIQN
jgi:hypothetical protein